MIVLESLGNRLATAGINTAICICVVFAVLIFISLIISLFRFIPKAEAASARRKAKRAEKKAQKKALKDSEKVIATEAIDKAVSQIEARETEELSDDCELVAVIAAAIAASTGTPTDGFVVRSIRKVRR